jgi:hypothetical protein
MVRSTLIIPNACLVVPSPSPHLFSHAQGRPKRKRVKTNGVFAPGWAPGTAPCDEDEPQAVAAARNVSARDSDKEGEHDEDSGSESFGVRGGEDGATSVGDECTGGGFYEDGGDADEEREEDGEDSREQEEMGEDVDLHGEVRKNGLWFPAWLQISFLR